MILSSRKAPAEAGALLRQDWLLAELEERFECRGIREGHPHSPALLAIDLVRLPVLDPLVAGRVVPKCRTSGVRHFLDRLRAIATATAGQLGLIEGQDVREACLLDAAGKDVELQWDRLTTLDRVPTHRCGDHQRRRCRSGCEDGVGNANWLVEALAVGIPRGDARVRGDGAGDLIVGAARARE